MFPVPDRALGQRRGRLDLYISLRLPEGPL